MTHWTYTSSHMRSYLHWVVTLLAVVGWLVLLGALISNSFCKLLEKLL